MTMVRKDAILILFAVLAASLPANADDARGKENAAKASRRECEFDQMGEVTFVRKADHLALATGHLLQSSSSSRVTASGITPCVPANRAVNNQGDFFDRTAFSYEPQTDTFRCPAGRTLVRKQVLTRKRSILYVAEDCSDCALKPRCTRRGESPSPSRRPPAKR